MSSLLASGWWYRPESLLDNAEFVYSALMIAPVVAVVALVAFLFRNRLIFLLGTAGCFAGLLFDRGGSTGGYLEHSIIRANDFLSFGIIGAMLGVSVAAALARWRKRRSIQSSSNEMERNSGQSLRRNRA